MKNRALLFTVVLGSIIFLRTALTTDAQPKDKAEIRQWLDQWAKAFRAHDLDAIPSRAEARSLILIAPPCARITLFCFAFGTK
jgi:hypothetical protein